MGGEACERPSPGRAPKLSRGCGKVKPALGGPGFPGVGVRGLSCAVDAFPRAVLSFQARLQTWNSMRRAGRHEADIQASQPQAGQQARVQGPHEDEGWAQDAQPSSASGSRSARREGRREVDVESRSSGESFPREARIRHSAEIRALLERGKRRRTKNLDVFFAASPASRPRFGVIVPKHGRRIVDRNLLKRRLREIGRRDVLPGLAASGNEVDVLVRARGSAYQAGFDALRREMLEALDTLWSQSS